MNMNYREYVWKSIWFLLDTVKRTKSEIEMELDHFNDSW